MYSLNFSGSALVSIFLKCWYLENLKKFLRKHLKLSETMVPLQTFLFVVLQKLPPIDLSLFLYARLLSSESC